MKKLVVSLWFSTVMAVVPTAAFAGHGDFFQPNEITPWIDRVSEEIRAYERSCGNLGDGSVNNLIRGLSNLESSVQNLRHSLGSGFESCSPRIRQLTRDFKALKQQFSAQLVTHPNPRVRLGWYKIERVYWELDWHLSRGMLPER